jgi:hypothetical protein
VRRVAGVGGGADRAFDRRQPLLEQILAHSDPARHHVAVLLDRRHHLAHRHFGVLAATKAGLRLEPALLGLEQLAAALRTGGLGLSRRPEALAATLAALRRGHADVDDVLPAAGIAAASDVASHPCPLARRDARASISSPGSRFALGRPHGKRTGPTRSTKSQARRDLLGAAVPTRLRPWLVGRMRLYGRTSGLA